MSHKHLTSEERFAIEQFLDFGLSCREIALRLGRSHTTIARELRRNGNVKGYRSQTAQRRADARKAQPRHYRRQLQPRLVAYVGEKLQNDWSPEQIAGRIRLDYPHDTQMRISVETVYRWVYIEAQHEGTVHQHLRRGRSKRRSQARYAKGKRFLPGRVSITERPKVVDERARFGDWEADLVSGSSGKSALMSCVDRKSQYLLASKVEDKTAASFNAAMTQQMQPIPTRLRQTLTLDNGSEMSRFKELEQKTELAIYFCEPRSPWQRGLIENCNGLLRQYFPRGVKFARVSEAAVRKAVDLLNNRPRKRLGYRTPAEVFSEALGGAFAIRI